MRTVLRASLRQHTRRYVAAVVAIVIGVAFIVTTGALSSAARNGMVSGLDAPYRAADVVASELDGEQAGQLLDHAVKSGARASVLGWAWLPVSKDGEQLSDGADVGAIAADESLRWQELTSGRFPERDDEAVVDTIAARSHGVEVGDVLTIGSGRTRHEVTVVGTVDSPSAMVWTAVYVTESQLRTWLDQAVVNSVAWSGPGSVEAQVDAVTSAVPDARVQRVAEFVDGEHQRATNGVDVIAIVLLLFAAVALLTSGIVITNTYSILFAQRSRDFALLRCIGATRRQVLRSIRLEALALGIASALLGIVVGTAVGAGLVALVQELWPAARLGDASVGWGWYAGAFATGLLVSLGAAWLPTRRAVRVSPLAALRPDTGVDVRSRAGRWQLATGVLLVAVGAAALAGAVRRADVLLMVTGGAATSVGVLVLGPATVPLLVRLLQRPAGLLLGTPGRLAADNTARNPRRTAATTSALLVGVTLTTAVLTGLATARTSLDAEMDADHPLDVAIAATDAQPLASDLAGQAADLPGVERAAGLPGVVAQVDGIGAIPLVAPTPEALALLRADAYFARPSDDEVYLPHGLVGDTDLPSRVTVVVGGERRRLSANVGDDWGEAAVVSPRTLRDLGGATGIRAVWLHTDLDADPDDLEAAVAGVAGGADVASTLQKRAYVDLQVDVLTGAILALLGIAVLIALVGIANTLGLSVIERSRENALLRALGLTRGQLRATLAAEAVLLSVGATLVGTALGVLFAWVGVHTMLSGFVEDATLALPVGQLLLVLLTSAAAGLLACVLPARRAARTPPAAGLALD